MLFMKLFFTCLLAFGQMASAADWIMGDDTCGKADRSTPAKSSEQFLDTWEAGVRTGMSEVQRLAEIALRVMDGEGGDFPENKDWTKNKANVETVAKCILGDDVSFQANWDKAKSKCDDTR
jgi:hypothetical protein